MPSVSDKIAFLADKYAQEVGRKTQARVEEMKQDDKSHFLIYRVLGVGAEEGELIDIYQNKGRFLYKYAGAFLEEAVVACFQERFPEAKRFRVANTLGRRPQQFEIDCLIGGDAIEIKWRDATTDGDHITKEHTRIQAIKQHGFTPVRLMFYQPNREQAVKIQAALKTLYHGIGGEYYSQTAAWDYVKAKTGIDLLAILSNLAQPKR
jgi:type II restriction enzyme